MGKKARGILSKAAVFPSRGRKVNRREGGKLKEGLQVAAGKNYSHQIPR